MEKDVIQAHGTTWNRESRWISFCQVSAENCRLRLRLYSILFLYRLLEAIEDSLIRSPNLVQFHFLTLISIGEASLLP